MTRAVDSMIPAHLPSEVRRRRDRLVLVLTIIVSVAALLWWGGRIVYDAGYDERVRQERTLGADTE